MRKKIGLVSQHLERIDSRALDNYQQIIRNYVRHREGVYALYKKDRLYYVGLARDLRWRLDAHLKDRHRKKWDKFSVYLTVNSQHLKELESLMLRVIRPKGNLQSGKFPMSENLLRQFKKDMNEYHKTEMRELLGLAPKRLKVETGKGANSLLATHVQRIGKSLRLEAKYKGRKYRALVQKDGTVRFKNRKYNSPSAAGEAVIQRACNGWAFWRYEHAPGQWVRLSKMRSK
jgi:hypothetical protein